MAADGSATPVLPAAKRGRFWWLTLLASGIALSMMLLGCLTLLDSQKDAWHRAQQNAGNLVLALDRDISRNFAVLDLSLQGLLEAMAEPGIEAVSPSIRQHALFDRSASAEDLGSMLVLDENGNIIADSTSLVPHRLNLGDRDYFKVHRNEPSPNLFISRAYESRIANGDLRLAISRRMNGADGQFAGVVLATLRLSYFRRLFEKLDIGSGGTITLMREDGRVLFRYPFRAQDVDVDMAKRSPNFPRFKASREGQYVAVAALDNVERLYTFRRVGDFPLILTVSLSTEEILQPWRRKAAVMGPVMVILCAAAVICSILFRREMLRRTCTERALAASNEKLKVLASTDPLTELLNRRAFDLEFDRAFRIAIRKGTPLAVLMIDADYFKRYNDMAGHVAGDEVLRAIAGCLKANLRRPDDVVARFGGEEFVAVLPETDAPAASALAETICRAVRDLQIPHPDSPVGIVSVSMGVAATMPLVGDAREQLLNLSDQMLYVAKQAGRDRVRSTAETQECGADLARLVHAATDRKPSVARQ